MGNPYNGKVELIKSSFYTEDLTDEQYFKDYTSHISNSALGLINYAQNGSPQRFLEGFSEKKTQSLELGTMVHKMILEGDLYTISPIEKPSGKVGDIIEVIHRLTNEGMQYDDALKQACIECDYYKGDPGEKRLAEIKSKGVEYLDFLRSNNGNAIVMTAAMKEKLKSCCNSINSNIELRKALFPKGEECYRELPILGNTRVVLQQKDEELDFIEEKEVIVPIKCKIDFFSIDRINRTVNLVDLKTTSKPVQTFMGYYKNYYDGKMFKPTYVTGSYQNYCYYRQMSFYSDILMQYLLNAKIIDDSYKVSIKMAVVETCNPFASALMPVDEYSIREGRREYEQLLRIYGYHNLNGFDKVVILNELDNDI